MSRPRGKGIQRELAKVVKDILEPLGFRCEVDFTKRGGHQQLLIYRPDRKDAVAKWELPSSPRSEGNALVIMRQKTQRFLREQLA